MSAVDLPSVTSRDVRYDAELPIGVDRHHYSTGRQRRLVFLEIGARHERVFPTSVLLPSSHTSLLLYPTFVFSLIRLPFSSFSTFFLSTPLLKSGQKSPATYGLLHRRMDIYTMKCRKGSGSWS